MASILTITFNSVPNQDEVLTISDSLTSVSLTETFKATRTSFRESEIGTSIISSAFNYSKAIGLDYNIINVYTIERVGNVVTVTAKNGHIFNEIENTTNGAVSVSVSNENATQDLQVTNVTISESNNNPCENIDVTVTTNIQADNMILPNEIPITTNPFTFQVQRNNTETIIKLSDSNSEVVKKIRVPQLLSSYFKINNLSTPSDNIISVEKLTPLSLGSLFVVEYSLDNSLWQTSGYFNNISKGDHTLYIRDNAGCSTNKTFSISDFSANVIDYEGVAKISNLNSIRYKEDVIWSASIPKTPDNTLSFEEDVKLTNYGFTQPFIKDDVIPTQLETNYANITAKIINKLGNETSLLVSKKTANMDITDVRDVVAESVNYNNTDYTCLKYSGGKTYNPITLAEESDYNIGSNVPDWINKDDYINIEGVGWYKVLDVIYSVDAYVVVINQVFSDFPFVTPKTLKATTVYNALDYENYEFDIDFSNYEGYYKVQVNFSDDRFISKQYLSEWLNIKESHPNTVLIEAYNTENNEINYATGIKHKMRLRLSEDIKWKPNSEIEVYTTDTNTVNLDTKYRGFWDLTAFPLPTIMAEKLVLMLLQDRLFINTVNYISEGEPESNPIGSQYQIKANLVKSNYVFELYSGKGEITIETTGVPLSISPGGGFLLVE